MDNTIWDEIKSKTEEVKMKIKDLEEEAIVELEEEDQGVVREEIKERLREIKCTKKLLDRLTKKYVALLESDTDDFLY